MDISIVGAIREGFRVANRSWAGIGFFAAALGLVTLTSIGVIVVTNPPVPAVPGRAETEPIPPATDAAAPGAEAPAPGTQDVNLFDQLETTQPRQAPSAEAPAPVPPAETVIPDIGAAGESENAQAVRDWLGRSWPAVAFVVLLILCANIWLSGGQIGYLARKLSGQAAKLSVFWQEGTAAFPRLLSGWGLLMLSAVVMLLALALVGAAMRPLPDALANFLGLLILVVLAVIGAWLVIRLSFWFIAIVVDRVGPLAGLKASWRVTKGRWWKVAGLALLIAVMSLVISLPFGLIEGLSQAIGGPVGVVLGALANIAGLVASLYVGFAALTAYIRLYQDLKAQPVVSPSS